MILPILIRAFRHLVCWGLLPLKSSWPQMATVSSSKETQARNEHSWSQITAMTACKGPLLIDHLWLQPLPHSSMFTDWQLVLRVVESVFPVTMSPRWKKKAVYLMNGLICFWHTFENNVVQRLSFTWGVSTQCLGSSYFGALKFWNLNILSTVLYDCWL